MFGISLGFRSGVRLEERFSLVLTMIKVQVIKSRFYGASHLSMQCCSIPVIFIFMS